MTVYEGKFYLNGDLVEASVLVEDGFIKKIKKYIPGGRALKGAILPAGVDTHVHFREPGFTQKEDMRTGTLAALYGGTTTVLDMPNTRPAVRDRESLEDKISRARGRVAVDIGFYAMFPPRAPLDELAMGYKLYMGETTAASPTAVPDEYTLSRPLVVHAMMPDCVLNKGYRNLAEYERTIPEACEAQAAAAITALKPENVHIAHVSSPKTVDAVKDKGATCEVTLHHIMLSTSSPKRGKVNPPLRSPATREALMSLFINGDIDFLVSDHAPHLPDEKDEDIMDAPAGIPGVEERLPVALNLYRSGLISLRRFVEAVAEKPAERFGISKGKISPGYRADFVAVHLADVVKIKSVHTRCGWSLYEGKDAVFPRTVVMGGEVVLENGELMCGKCGTPLTP